MLHFPYTNQDIFSETLIDIILTLRLIRLLIYFSLTPLQFSPYRNKCKCNIFKNIKK